MMHQHMLTYVRRTYIRYVRCVHNTKAVNNKWYFLSLIFLLFLFVDHIVGQRFYDLLHTNNDGDSVS